MSAERKRFVLMDSRFAAGSLFLRWWLTHVLIFLLIAPPAVYGQAAAPQTTTPMAPLPVVQNLRVIALAGADEMNDLERRVMAPLVVQVLDQNDRPVEGADVVFRFPLNGPGATFPDQKTSQTTRTDASGQAAATGWTANGIVGTFQVRVTATSGNQMGEQTISMSNVTRIVEDMRKKKEKSWWATKRFKILVVAGAAAAVAGIILAKQIGGDDSPPTVTISPGSPTIGGPQ